MASMGAAASRWLMRYMDPPTSARGVRLSAISVRFTEPSLEDNSVRDKSTHRANFLVMPSRWKIIDGTRVLRGSLTRRHRLPGFEACDRLTAGSIGFSLGDRWLPSRSCRNWLQFVADLPSLSQTTKLH